MSCRHSIALCCCCLAYVSVFFKIFMAACVSAPRRAIRTDLGISCQQVFVRLIVSFTSTDRVVNAPVVGAPSLCAHLFRAMSDIISIRASTSDACCIPIWSVSREGVVFSLTIEEESSIGNDFLIHFRDCLEHVTLRALPNVTCIGDNFIAFRESLRSLHLTSLASVTSVGHCFLSGCRSLHSLDLTPLASVTSVGSFFLGDCASLRALDLAPLSSITHVGSHFLSECSSLTALDLAPLSNVQRLGASFLAHCSSLRTLDVTPLIGATEIGYGFLYGRSLFMQVDLTPIYRQLRGGRSSST